MKLKLILLFNLYIFVGISESKCQDYSIDWGRESFPNEVTEPIKIIGEKDGYVYLYKNGLNAKGSKVIYLIEKYSENDLQLIYSNEIEMPKSETGKKTDFSNIFLLNGKLLLITNISEENNNTAIQKKTTISYYYATLLNEKGVIENPSNIIYQDEQDKTVYNRNHCGFILSEDQTKIYIYSGNITNHILSGQIIDSELKIKSNINIDISSVGDYKLSSPIFNDNHIYFLSEEKTIANEKNIYNYGIIDYDLQIKKQKKVPLKSNNEYIENIQMQIQDKNTLYITGNTSTYTKSFKRTSIQMLFYKIEIPTLSSTLICQNTLDNQTLLKFDQNIKYDYYLSKPKILELKTGEYIITSEQIAYSYIGSILIQFISKNGTIINNTVIPKRQVGTSYSAFSYLQFYKNNSLHIVFNDNEKNLNLKDPYKLKGGIFNTNGIFPVDVSINSTGEWIKKPFFDIPTPDAKLYLSLSQEINPKQIITFSQNGQKVKILKIKY